MAEYLDLQVSKQRKSSRLKNIKPLNYRALSAGLGSDTSVQPQVISSELCNSHVINNIQNISQEDAVTIHVSAGEEEYLENSEPELSVQQDFTAYSTHYKSISDALKSKAKERETQIG